MNASTASNYILEGYFPEGFLGVLLFRHVPEGQEHEGLPSFGKERRLHGGRHGCPVFSPEKSLPAEGWEGGLWGHGLLVQLFFRRGEEQ